MNLANCPQCGKLYVKNAAGICPDCRAEYEEQVERVLEYMRNVRNASVNEISEATGVKPKIILDLIKRGALTGSNFTISYPCEKCGKLIEQGRFCNACSSKLNKEINPKAGYKPAETKYSQKDNSKWYTST